MVYVYVFNYQHFAAVNKLRNNISIIDLIHIVLCKNRRMKKSILSICLTLGCFMMKKASTVLSVIFASLVAFSCRQGSNDEEVAFVFPKVVQGRVEALSGPLMASGVEQLYRYKDYFVLAYRTYDEGQLHIFSSDGELLLNAMPIGRGPGELSRITSMDLNPDTGEIVAYDVTMRRAVRLNVDDLLTGQPVIPEEYPVPEYSEYYTTDQFFPLAGGRDLVVRSYGMIVPDSLATPRIGIYDYAGNLLSGDDHFFLEDRVERIRYATSYSQTAFSTDRHKLVIYSGLNLVLETFDIGKEVRHLATRVFSYSNPLDEVEKHKVVNGFYGLAGTKDYIYASYDGEALWLGGKQGSSKRIGVFDWNGRPVRRIDVDRSISRIFVDAGVIYVIFFNEEGECFIGRVVTNGS